MCCYKLCRIECAFWGCQSRVEKLISDSVLRHTILVSHRQAWCWQDEYYNLTMDDVRQLEIETQNYLNKKMKNQEDLESVKLNGSSKSVHRLKKSSSDLTQSVTLENMNINIKREEYVYEHTELNTEFEFHLNILDHNIEDSDDLFEEAVDKEEFYDAICIN